MEKEATSDFASAVLVAAVQRALRRDGIAVEALIPRDALLSLDIKRRLLLAVAEAHGLLPLLKVGSVLPDLPADPAISALAAARGTSDLFERWARLERFTHSQHRVVVVEAGERHLVAEHVGPSGQPPAVYEDVLILGVLTALVERIGIEGLTVEANGRRLFSDGCWAEPPPDLNLSRWCFEWARQAIAPPNAASDVREVGPQVSRLMLSDLGRRWTLDTVAEALATSSRSLQRRLTGEGGFGNLLAGARAQAAADLLIGTSHAVSIVGFACGYSDQPHFTREFKRRTAMTPVAYRKAFAAGQGLV